MHVSCKKLVDVSPPVTSINAENVYATDATAISVVTSMYKNMTIADNFTGITSISLRAGLSADEWTLYAGVTHQLYLAYYKNALVSNVTLNYGTEAWTLFYNYIFVCNSVIEGASASSSLSESIKNQLLGEAKFVRAFIYFYLVNLFGDVPLPLTTDWKANALLSRTSHVIVYDQIIADLLDAQDLLRDEYLDGTLLKPTIDRIRPTKWAANALLARVYLYVRDFSNAEIQASKVINNIGLYSIDVPLNAVFLKNSKEAIWQLMPTIVGWNTQDARTFIIPSSGPSDPLGNPNANPVYLSPTLLNSFELGDQRKDNWVKSVTVSGTTYQYAYKYRSATLNAPQTEYLMVLRLAEQYLIRAEARAQLNRINEGRADLNVLRTRAGLLNSGATTKESLLSEILNERRVELFSEWGHRWFDIRRTGNVNAIMTIASAQKGGSWSSYKQLYPILFSDIQKNVNLAQNDGY